MNVGLHALAVLEIILCAPGHGLKRTEIRMRQTLRVAFQ